MIKKTALFKQTLLLSLFTTSLLASNHKVSLNEAIDIALLNNAKLKISQTEIEIADAMHKQAMSANYPTLDLDIKAMRMDEAPTFEMRGTTTIDNSQTKAMYSNLSNAALADSNPNLSGTYAAIEANTPNSTELPVNMDVQLMGRDTIMSQLSLQYPLYTGGKISAIIKQAGLGKKIAQEGKRRTNNEVIYDVKRYYYAAMLTKKLTKLSEDTLERMRFVRDLTSRLYQGGSNKLAIDLQGGMLSSLRKPYKNVKDGGVRPAPFWVLVGAQMPSVLVEVGFITHPTEARRLVKRDYQKKIALGLANGIERYFLYN